VRPWAFTGVLWDFLTSLVRTLKHCKILFQQVEWNVVGEEIYEAYSLSVFKRNLDQSWNCTLPRLNRASWPAHPSIYPPVCAVRLSARSSVSPPMYAMLLPFAAPHDLSVLPPARLCHPSVCAPTVCPCKPCPWPNKHWQTVRQSDCWIYIKIIISVVKQQSVYR